MCLQTQNDFLKEYLIRRHSILIELLRHESLPSRTECTNCQKSSGTHRCRDCFGNNLWCDSCCVILHRSIPFHRVQVWNGRFFEESDLLTRELPLDLSHDSEDCSSMSDPPDIPDAGDELPDESEPQETTDWRTNCQSQSNLTIVSSVGIFKRSVRWCHCMKSSDQYIQLLRAKLFPASFRNPKTVFTFEVLDHFRLDALECKTSAMNFMSKIQRITNEAFPSNVPVSILRYRITIVR